RSAPTTTDSAGRTRTPSTCARSCATSSRTARRPPAAAPPPPARWRRSGRGSGRRRRSPGGSRLSEAESPGRASTAGRGLLVLRFFPRTVEERAHFPHGRVPLPHRHHREVARKDSLADEIRFEDAEEPDYADVFFVGGV